MSRNDNPLDFGSPFADVQKFLVPVMTLDGVFLHQTINHMQFI